MRAHALLALMTLGREQDLAAVLEALQVFPLYDFLHERARLEDPILRAVVERVRETATIEYMVAGIQSRDELEAALLQELATAPRARAAVLRVIRTLGCLGGNGTYPPSGGRLKRSVRRGARRRLAFLSQAAPAEEFSGLLMDALNDQQPRVRAEALRRSKTCRSPGRCPGARAPGQPGAGVQVVLIDYLGAPRVGARRVPRWRPRCGSDVASRALWWRPGTRAASRRAALLETFLEAAEPGCAGRRRSLSQVPGQKAATLLEGCLQDPDVRVRLGALDAAVGLGATEGLPILRRALEDPVVDVRRMAILRLSRLASHDALDEFEAASRDVEPRVRAAALAALAVEGSQPVEDRLGAADVPALAEALRELGTAEELEAPACHGATGRKYERCAARALLRDARCGRRRWRRRGSILATRSSDRAPSRRAARRWLRIRAARYLSDVACVAQAEAAAEAGATGTEGSVKADSAAAGAPREGPR